MIKNIFTISIAKTITYRIIGSLTTFSISVFLTNDVKTSLVIGSSDLIIKPLIYFFHEIIWQKWCH